MAMSVYVVVWFWLVALVGISIAAASALPKEIAIALIFAAATAKALLVALHYMHLKRERALLYAIALVPLAVVAILFVALLPDIALDR
jgi:caa(3)-type oxidase subunit IV